MAVGNVLSRFAILPIVFSGDDGRFAGDERSEGFELKAAALAAVGGAKSLVGEAGFRAGVPYKDPFRSALGAISLTEVVGANVRID